MKKNTLDHFRCIKCEAGKLNITAFNQSANNDEIIEAQLKCQTCGAFYPVKDGIPRFVPNNSYADSFSLQWNLNRKTQLDSYTGLSISRSHFYQTTEWPENLGGLAILEAGSGAGRFTEVLLKSGATIFSFDISGAVNANYANNGTHQNLHLFQADIRNIPLQKKAFDRVTCLGVLQHTPDPGATFASLAEYVCPGGELVIDVYAKRFISMLSWKYLLRPLTRRINKQRLYEIIQVVVPVLLPLSIFLRRIAGRFGARLMPIAEYSYLGLSYELNRQWVILDTFDMYSPKYDNPQTISTVKKWFKRAGFVNIVVKYGPNGIVGRGNLAG